MIGSLWSICLAGIEYTPIVCERQEAGQFELDFLPYLRGKPAFGIHSGPYFTIAILIKVPHNFYFNSTFVTKARFRMKQIWPQ